MPSVRLSHLAAALLAIALTAPFSASAGTLTCTGTIDQVRLVTDGSLQVLPSWLGDWVALCNVNAVWKTVPVEVCKRLHASALTAQATQGPTTTYYGSTTAVACAAMPIGTGADAPTYFTNQ